MISSKLAGGVVHAMPADLRKALTVSDKARTAWQDITPLARNEWICLVTSAKQPETRVRRLQRTINQLSDGKRRPCCWVGCDHRNK